MTEQKIKQCNECRQFKSVKLFAKEIHGKNGLRAVCKDCRKMYREKNKVRFSIREQVYRDTHKNEMKKYQQDYNIKNKEEISKKQKLYRQTHRAYFAKYSNKWRLEHPEHKIARRLNIEKNKQRIREQQSNYEKERLKTNINFKLRKYLRNRQYAILKGFDKSKHTLELLGCSIEFFKQHLEAQFQPGMNWNNYGSGWNGKGMKEWHVDHIKPCSSFDLIDPKQQEQCEHYTNKQPMWATENIRKGNK